jgi:hypothetical protein
VHLLCPVCARPKPDEAWKTCGDMRCRSSLGGRAQEGKKRGPASAEHREQISAGLRRFNAKKGAA